MARFVLGTIGRFVLLMLAVSLAVFVLVDLSPIDPLQANLGQAALLGMSDEKRAALAERWGAHTPWPERYAAWAGALAQGDLGTSLRYNQPVAQVIAERAGNSLALMGIAWVVSGVLGFALGVAAALRRGRRLDRAVRAYCFVLASSPTFGVGLLLLTVAWAGSRSGSRCRWGRRRPTSRSSTPCATWRCRRSRSRSRGWPTSRCTRGPRPST